MIVLDNDATLEMKVKTVNVGRWLLAQAEVKSANTLCQYFKGVERTILQEGMHTELPLLAASPTTPEMLGADADGELTPDSMESRMKLPMRLSVRSATYPIELS